MLHLSRPGQRQIRGSDFQTVDADKVHKQVAVENEPPIAAFRELVVGEYDADFSLGQYALVWHLKRELLEKLARSGLGEQATVRLGRYCLLECASSNNRVPDQHLETRRAIKGFASDGHDNYRVRPAKARCKGKRCKRPRSYG